jgi:hypothetical protein
MLHVVTQKLLSLGVPKTIDYYMLDHSQIAEFFHWIGVIGFVKRRSDNSFVQYPVVIKYQMTPTGFRLYIKEYSKKGK